MVNRLLVILD